MIEKYRYHSFSKRYWLLLLVVIICDNNFDCIVCGGAARIGGSRSSNGIRSVSSNNNSNSNSNSSTSSIPVKIIGYDVHGLPVYMPLLGAGTWQYNDTIAYQSLCKAFHVGYTMVDTAFNYGNEKGVGNAVKDCYTGKREDLFILTKVPGGLSFQETLAAHHQNMFHLNVEYVDHLMVHYPSDWDVKHASKDIRQNEWKALEEIYYTGKARSIGISHYCAQHIEDIIEIATVIPSINQVEYHVGSKDVNNVMETCQKYNITFMSYSPLCGPCQYDAEDSLISGDLVTSIANKYENVTGSQVSLRFIVQQALNNNKNTNSSSNTSLFNIMGGVIPKSNNIDHIRSNMNIFTFELLKEDMDKLLAATKPEPEIGDCDVP